MSQKYLFTHHLMVDLVLGAEPEKVIRLLTGPGVDYLLEDIWGEAADEPFDEGPDDLDEFIDALASGDFVPTERDLPQMSFIENQEGRGILIRMPTPESATEGYFAFVAFGERIRYFTLERSESEEGEEPPMLCEWAGRNESRRHLNYGSVPEPTAEAFLEAMSRIMTS